MKTQSSESVKRQCKTICLPFTPSDYAKIVPDAKRFRVYVDKMFKRYPELFPVQIENGYKMKDSSTRVKIPIVVRRIKFDIGL